MRLIDLFWWRVLRVSTAAVVAAFVARVSQSAWLEEAYPIAFFYACVLAFVMADVLGVMRYKPPPSRAP